MFLKNIFKNVLNNNDDKNNKLQTMELKKHYIAFYNTFGNLNAEYELLLRFEKICNELNIGFLMISNANIILNDELKGININETNSLNILFIISMHHFSPKTTKYFTLITLWHPIRSIRYESEWKNTYSADGYLSAYSEKIDNYVKSNSNKPFLGYLNPTIGLPVLDFSFGRYKCFYIAIYYLLEKDNIRKNIFNLINILDETDMIEFYGPDKFWNNKKKYKSYIGSIPFDGGKTIVKTINECGVCLVLSSDLHIEDGVNSCRIFEGLAAGVPIISDKNPFIQKWFGDNIFYIDNQDSSIAVEQIKEHIEFFKNNPNETLEKMKKCREIFLNNFLLEKQFLKVINDVENYKNSIKNSIKKFNIQYN
jgi:glycosyltransferase involved in cell wall biosynthesis